MAGKEEKTFDGIFISKGAVASISVVLTTLIGTWSDVATMQKTAFSDASQEVTSVLAVVRSDLEKLRSDLATAKELEAAKDAEVSRRLNSLEENVGSVRTRQVKK